MEEEEEKMTKERVLKKALFAGLRKNRTDVVEFVLTKGLDPSFDDNWAVIHCAKNGKLEYLKMLLKHDSVIEKIKSDSRMLAMSLAIRFNNVEIIEYLLSIVYIDMSDSDKDQLYSTAESYNKELKRYFE